MTVQRSTQSSRRPQRAANLGSANSAVSALTVVFRAPGAFADDQRTAAIPSDDMDAVAGAVREPALRSSALTSFSGQLTEKRRVASVRPVCSVVNVSLRVAIRTGA